VSKRSVHLPDRAKDELAADARNRSWRTFLNGITVDVAIALLLVLTQSVGSAQGWDDFEWGVLAFTFAKTAVMTAGSYVLRRYLDASRFPTPLPPAPVAAPAVLDDGSVVGLDVPRVESYKPYLRRKGDQ
jgi:hypothetical protein